MRYIKLLESFVSVKKLENKCRDILIYLLDDIDIHLDIDEKNFMYEWYYKITLHYFNSVHKPISWDDIKDYIIPLIIILKTHIKTIEIGNDLHTIKVSIDELDDLKIDNIWFVTILINRDDYDLSTMMNNNK